MPRKSGQGRVSRNRGFLSKADGSTGGICSVIRGGKVYLGYKVSGAWYYAEMSKRPNVSKKVLPPKYDNIKNNNREKIVAKKLKLNSNLGFTNRDNLPDGPRGVAFQIGRSKGDVHNSMLNSLKVVDISTSQADTIDLVSLVSFDDWILDSTNSEVTTVNVATLDLGVPVSKYNDGTYTNNLGANFYSLKLGGDIKSSGLTIDDDGDIQLNAAGADINFQVAGTTRLNWNATAGMKFHSLADLTDYFYIQPAIQAGEVMIGSHDDSGANGGHIQFNMQGDIDFKPATEKVKIRQEHKLYFDHATSSPDDHTYIYESADDILDFYVGSVNMLKLTENAGSSVALLSADVRMVDYDASPYSGTNSASVQTKAQIESMIVQTAEVTISEAEMNALHTTEKELVAAQGSGKVIIPLRVTAFVDRDSSTAQGLSCTLWIAHAGETTVGAFGYFKRFMRLLSGDRIQTWYAMFAAYHGSAGDNTSIDNRNLTAKLDNPITTGSIDSCKMVVQYYVYDNS